MFSSVGVSVAGLALASLASAALDHIEADGEGNIILGADGDGVDPNATTIEWIRSEDPDTTDDEPFREEPLDADVLAAINNDEFVTLTPPDGCGPGYCFLRIGDSYSPRIESTLIAGGLDDTSEDDDDSDDVDDTSDDTDDDDDSVDPEDEIRKAREDLLEKNRKDHQDALDQDDDDEDDDDDDTDDDDDENGTADTVETPDVDAAGSLVVSSVVVMCSMAAAMLL